MKLDDSKHEIVEGQFGYWHYHLRNRKETGNWTGSAFCGERRVMTTSMPVGRWKVPFGEHFPKRPTWCKECERLRANAPDED